MRKLRIRECKSGKTKMLSSQKRTLYFNKQSRSTSSPSFYPTHCNTCPKFHRAVIHLQPA